MILQWRTIRIILVPIILSFTGCLSMSKREQNALEAFQQGNTFREAGQFEDAAAAYRKTLKLRPNTAAASYNLALTLSDLEGFDESIQILESLERQDPRNIKILQAKGWVYRQAGQYEEAETSYYAVLEIFPNDITAIKSLANIYEHLGQVAKALNLIEKLLPMDDSVENHTVLARLYGLVNSPQAVLKEYKWIESHGTLTTQDRFDAGKTAEKLGLFDEAMDYYRQVGTANAEESMDAWFLLARMQLVTLQDFASGLASLEQAISLGFQDDKALYNLLLEVSPDIHPSIESLLARQEGEDNTSSQ